MFTMNELLDKMDFRPANTLEIKAFMKQTKDCIPAEFYSHKFTKGFKRDDNDYSYNCTKYDNGPFANFIIKKSIAKAFQAIDVRVKKIGESFMINARFPNKNWNQVYGRLCSVRVLVDMPNGGSMISDLNEVSFEELDRLLYTVRLSTYFTFSELYVNFVPYTVMMNDTKFVRLYVKEMLIKIEYTEENNLWRR